jgi:RNA polymerase sigma factor (sigma-70 family)
LLRIRTDEQLVTLFREGNDDAFRVIHDRYRGRMVAYTRQMLGATGQDPEDAVQEVFVRAYYGLRATHRHLALRAWLYRIAHNRCVDDLRRPHPLTEAVGEHTPARTHDPVIKAEQRDALRRLIGDVQRLPEHQRSALLMRELSGMPYTEVSDALGVSVPAVKSLLVRARIGLAQASEARNTACADIRADVILAHDRGVRTSGLARRHMRDCQSCRQFRAEVRGVSRQFAALTPALGPLGLLANLFGLGGGGGAAASSGGLAGASAAAGGTVGTGAATSAGVLAGSASHVATLLAAAVVTAGGAVEIQRTLAPTPAHHAHVRLTAPRPMPTPRAAPASPAAASPAPASPDGGAPVAAPQTPPAVSPSAAQAPRAAAQAAAAAQRAVRRAPISMVLDPDMYLPPDPNASSVTGSGSTIGPGGATSSSGVAGSTTGASGSSTGSSGNAVSGSSGSSTSSSGSSTGTSGSQTQGSSGTQSSSSGQGTSSSQAAPLTTS